MARRWQADGGHPMVGRRRQATEMCHRLAIGSPTVDRWWQFAAYSHWRTDGVVLSGNWRKSPTPDYPKPDYQALTIRSRTINLRHRGSRQPPQGPAWPQGNYLPDVLSLPLSRQEDYYYCRVRAGFPYIYGRIYLRTRSVGHTI